ncbi:MAG: DUF739 family protein [Clostridia bacterium]|nr:DUF739 family protein [Clostridia bacterium]
MAKDFSKLKGRIVEKFGTQKAFCEALGKAPEWLSRRMNNQIEFDADDMVSIIDILEIDPQDLHLYFLCPNVL